MIKPVTFTLFLAVCTLNVCLASRDNSNSTPRVTIVDSSVPEYKKKKWKRFMQEFVPVEYIRKSLKESLSEYKEAKKVIKYFNNKYQTEKVVSIPLFINSLHFSPEYKKYESFLSMLFGTDLLFDISYLHEKPLTNFILFFTKEAVHFPIPYDIIGIIQRFLKCLSYEKDMKFDIKYYFESKPFNIVYGIALLGRVVNSASHFWMVHYQNKEVVKSSLPTSQLKLKVYKPEKKSYHFFKREVNTHALYSFELKNQFSFFEYSILEKLYLIGLTPSKYLLINSVGDRFDDHNNRVEYGILEKNRTMKGIVGTNHCWKDVSSYDTQSKVHILGATCRGIAHRTFDCHFNSFLPSQYQGNLMSDYDFYKVFTEKNNGHFWGFSDDKITPYYRHYQEHRAALLFDLCKETCIIECVSKKGKRFSDLDTSGNLVALSRYQESIISFLDKRASIDEKVATYSLEKIEKECSIKKVHFLSDPNYLLAQCHHEFYLIDRRYAIPIQGITNLGYSEKTFLKDYNLLIETNYGVSRTDYIHYISINQLK